MGDVTPVLRHSETQLTAAARECHAVSGHTLPSGRLSRWDDLTTFQVNQFCAQAKRILRAADNAS